MVVYLYVVHLESIEASVELTIVLTVLQGHLESTCFNGVCRLFDVLNDFPPCTLLALPQTLVLLCSAWPSSRSFPWQFMKLDFSGPPSPYLTWPLKKRKANHVRILKFGSKINQIADILCDHQVQRLLQSEFICFKDYTHILSRTLYTVNSSPQNNYKRLSLRDSRCNTLIPNVTITSLHQSHLSCKTKYLVHSSKAPFYRKTFQHVPDTSNLTRSRTKLGVFGPQGFRVTA